MTDAGGEHYMSIVLVNSGNFLSVVLSFLSFVPSHPVVVHDGTRTMARL